MPFARIVPIRQTERAKTTKMTRRTKPKPDQFESELQLQVTNRVDQTLAAIVRPISITSTAAEGLVQWRYGSWLPDSIVTVHGEGTAWGQRLSLVWAAAREHCEQMDFIFGAGVWAEAILKLPDLLGEPGDKVRVTIDSNSWHAALQVDNMPELAERQPIPESLRDLDVGFLLVEMTSRLFLGHSWLTLQLTPPVFRPTDAAGSRP